jgi:hypothetical protein
MARKSVIDKHPKRSEIIDALRENVPIRKISETYGIALSSVHRYKQKLLAEDVKETAKDDRAQELAEIEPEENLGQNLLNDLHRMKQDLYTIQQKAEDNPALAIHAIDKQIKVVDTLVKIASEVRQQQQTDIQRHPEFIKFRDAVIKVMKEFPGAEERLNELYE